MPSRPQRVGETIPLLPPYHPSVFAMTLLNQNDPQQQPQQQPQPQQHVSFAPTIVREEFVIDGRSDPSYGTTTADATEATLSERGIDEPPVLKIQHHSSILNHSRRMQLRSSRSLGAASLRNLGKALTRQASVMSIYSPLEATRDSDTGLPPRSLTCVVMNLISAGYILLPYAFAQAGSLLSSIVLLLVVLQTYVSGNFLLVAGAHAEALNNHKSLGGTLPVNYSFALRNRKYEVSHLYRIFMTKIEALFFTFTTIGDLYGISWALISIFASTLAEGIPFSAEVDSYKIYLLIFICFAIPMSCSSVIDQVWVQLVFLFLRTVMVLCMLGTLIAAMGKTHFGELDGPVNDIPLADFSNIVPIIMTSIFSTAYQFSVPCIAASSQDIKKVPRVFQTATTFVYTSNIVVAILISFYFGRSHILPSSNLLWNNYHGGHIDGDTPWWATAISSYVTLFAAIDGAAVYPLLAIGLGDILMGTVYGDNVHAAEENWKIRICFRLLGAIPQAVGAIFVSDLSVIATFAGICTLLSYTTAPALVFLHSRQAAKNAKIPMRTHYTTRLSSPIMAVTNVLLSLGIIGAVIADSVI